MRSRIRESESRRVNTIKYSSGFTEGLRRKSAKRAELASVYICPDRLLSSMVGQSRYNNSILISIQTDAYPYGAYCDVSLDAENKDDMVDFNIGDEVIVYYDGNIAESYPLQINTVYAISLKDPAN